MENTFTFTARSALASERVVTFTLYDQHMAVDVGAPLEHVERVVRGLGDEPETDAEAESPGGAQTAYALKPAAVSLLEKSGRPFDIGDVYAQAKGDALTVTAWVRAKGLRLAPVRFAWKQVDNPEAAHAFAEEIRARSQDAPHPGRFRGLMDYWISWLLLGVLLFALFMPRRDQEDQD